jgi:hypothetical protein
MPKIIVKNNMYHWNKEKDNHIWSVKFNPANGIYFVANEKTSKEWQLLANEFILGQRYYNEVTDTFPGYVHNAIWAIQDYHFHVRRGY